LRLRQWIFQTILRLTVGDVTRFGLPAPDHRVLETHPIVNSQLVYHVGHGDIVPMPDVVRFERNRVVFADGGSADPDLVVFATGYRPRFDFLKPELYGADESGRPHLRTHLFSRTHPTLTFAGLVQPDSGVFAIVHWQAVLIAAWLRALDTTPDRALRWWGDELERADRRYTEARVKDSTRHWFEVSHWVYLRALERALTELTAVRA
jgi:hypothetical protein